MSPRWNADCFKDVPLNDVPRVLIAGELAEALYWIHRGDFVHARSRWLLALALYERILAAPAGIGDNDDRREEDDSSSR